MSTGGLLVIIFVVIILLLIGLAFWSYQYCNENRKKDDKGKRYFSYDDWCKVWIVIVFIVFAIILIVSVVMFTPSSSQCYTASNQCSTSSCNCCNNNFRWIWIILFWFLIFGGGRSCCKCN